MPDIQITIIGAENVLNVESGGWFGGGKSDPYVVVRQGEKQLTQTAVVQDSLNPIWNHSFSFEGTTEDLVFHLWDDDTLSFDESLGTVTVAVESFKESFEGTFPIKLGRGKEGSGDLRLKVVVVPDAVVEEDASATAAAEEEAPALRDEETYNDLSGLIAAADAQEAAKEEEKEEEKKEKEEEKKEEKEEEQQRTRQEDESWVVRAETKEDVLDRFEKELGKEAMSRELTFEELDRIFQKLTRGDAGAASLKTFKEVHLKTTTYSTASLKQVVEWAAAGKR